MLDPTGSDIYWHSFPFYSPEGGNSSRRSVVCGRYVRHAQGTPIANLYTALLDTLGVHVERFGYSTGTVETLA